MKKTITKTTVLTGFPMALLCCLLAFGQTTANAQSGGACENTSSYGSATIGAEGDVQEIANDQYLGSEYSTVTGISAGNNYLITHSGGAYITVREGAVDGSVVASGFSPLTYLSSSSSDIYIHWTEDASCTVNGGGSYLTEITNLGPPPCETSSMYPGSPVDVEFEGVLPTQISDDQYDGAEYSVISSIVAGHSYEFTHSNGAYATVREGAADGPLVGRDYVPLTVIALSGADLYVHWTTDDACTEVASGSNTTTVQDLGGSNCENSSPYGTADAGAEGERVEIGSCAYISSEYSVVSEIIAGNNYTLEHDAGSWVTVREGAVGGPIVGVGFSPLTFTAASGSDIYVHWNDGPDCSVTVSGCEGIYVTNQGLPPCENSDQYPSGAFAIPPTGDVEIIVTDAYEGDEYTQLTDVLDAHEYSITHSDGAYITVRIGAVDGPLLGRDYSPLVVQTTSTDDLYVHWTVDDNCTTSSSSFSSTTTVQDLGVPPCNNDEPLGGQWPSSAVDAGSSGVTNINGCNYEDEYSIIDGITSSTVYQFTSTGGGGYITVTVGAVDGPVLGSGFSPLDVTTLTTDDLYVHWNVDEFCATNDGSPCVATTVENLGPGCAAASGTSTADASPVCLGGSGEAIISATPDGNAVMPSGYVMLGVLADASGNLLDAGSLSYTVNAAGDYYIHVGVINQTDALAYQSAATIADLHALTIDGGGSLCGSIDQTGTLVTVIDCPDNDRCDNAETLVCGVATTGTTVGATDMDTPTTCGTLTGDLGVWYTFTGTGGDVEISTCGPVSAASASAFIAVYSGPNCAQLTCVGNNFTSAGPSVCATPNGVSVGFTSTASTTYYVFVAANSGAPATIDFDLLLTCEPPTGITENSMEDINVYPNPSNGQFVVEVNGVEADAQITIMDVAGRQVYTEGVIMNGNFRKELNLDVARGTYLLQIATVEGMVTRKIQIQ